MSGMAQNDAQERQPKSTGIKEIAQALGVSIGTVDRALHGRPAIRPATRARVLQVAEQLGYRPNMAARSLKLNKHLRIGVYLPKEIASFFEPLRAGIRAAASAVASGGVNFELVFRTFPRLDKSEAKMLEADADQKLDGIIITPGSPANIEPLLKRVASAGTAVVYVGNDAMRGERLASVSADSYVCGSIAAELFARTLKQTGYVANLTGDLSIDNHADKLRGFAATLAVLAPHLSLLPVLESHERARDAYRQALTLADRRPRPLGIYISTANGLSALQALEERNMLGEIQVITTDLSAELVPFIESGMVLATLHQRPFTQGKAAFDALFQFLANGTRPELSTRLPPHIVLRSNLSLFTKDL
jgi:LacI family transcriptional regulator